MMAKKHTEVKEKTVWFPQARERPRDAGRLWGVGQKTAGRSSGLCAADRTLLLDRELVPDSYRSQNIYRFRQVAPYGTQYEGWNLPLGHQGKVRSFAREFAAAIKFEARFAKEFGGEAHVLGAVHSPEPQLFFVALQEVQALFELLHAPIK
jgi:hypothetical protein